MNEKTVAKFLVGTGYTISFISVVWVLIALCVILFGSDSHNNSAWEGMVFGVLSFLSSIVFLGFAYIVKAAALYINNRDL